MMKTKKKNFFLHSQENLIWKEQINMIGRILQCWNIMEWITFMLEILEITMMDIAEELTMRIWQFTGFRNLNSRATSMISLFRNMKRFMHQEIFQIQNFQDYEISHTQFFFVFSFRETKIFFLISQQARAFKNRTYWQLQ